MPDTRCHMLDARCQMLYGERWTKIRTIDTAPFRSARRPKDEAEMTGPRSAKTGAAEKMKSAVTLQDRLLWVAGGRGIFVARSR